MIINHLLLKLNDSDATKIKETKDVLLGMKGNIPALLDIQVEVDIRHDASSYDLILITKFASMRDMETYLADPLHLQVAKFIGSVLDTQASVCCEI
ncbi:stress protein [Paenibacillus sp. FSL H8-0548]|uniref:Dabb family protein n=1 Tax=Paenibacillus sp. FSL H8-0548 TaxID=1920422 RepID=UPI00096C74D7|nr:Dabb family protein [Paenibacillus sp. FSL H8-0548]OMF23864.1 stress protein [Paenibacillus sp. FSL H8-0548]